MVNSSSSVYGPRGPERRVGVPGERRGGPETNTTAVLEEELRYTDEEPEITFVLPGAGWGAEFEDGSAEKLVAWVVMDSGEMYGCVLQGNEGTVDVNRNVADEEGFKRYVNEIRREYGGEQAKILTSLFELAATAVNETPSPVDPETRARISTSEYNNLLAADAAAVAKTKRDEAKDRYLTLDLELRAAVEERAVQIEEYLSPSGDSGAELAQAMSLDEERLISLADIAARGNMENSLWVALAVARQRGLELAEAHIAELMEEDGWPELLVELAEAAEVTIMDEDEIATRFETLAQSAPTKQDILTGPKSPLNITAAIR